MTVKILGYSIRNRRFVGNTFEESCQNGTATVHIRGWDHDTKVDVRITTHDSDIYIVCKAAARSGIDWEWPWWRRSANRKLKYLKKNGVQS
jgi:hypothetical protein